MTTITLTPELGEAVELAVERSGGQPVRVEDPRNHRIYLLVEDAAHQSRTSPNEAGRSSDLDIPEGTFFGLLGPNGAGKTTLISAVCNLIRITAGDIRIFGLPHDSLEARRLIGLAEQDVNLDRFLDVEETLLYHGGYYGMARAHAKRWAGEMMDVFDLHAKASTRAPKLSGGMRRRLLLARGLVHEPKLILLDEPTVGLDPQIRTELWTLIDNLRAGGTTILMSTHYIEEAERLADEVAVMTRGRVISRGRPAELIAKHAGRETAEIYAAPARLAEARARAEAATTRTQSAAPPSRTFVRSRAVGDALNESTHDWSRLACSSRGEKTPVVGRPRNSSNALITSPR